MQLLSPHNCKQISKFFSPYLTAADEGISGTQTEKRVQFLKMMADAEAGLFDLILTKEVSRFSRNLLDTIAYTRRMKALGIEIRFLTDGISTMEPDAELRLSIMASLAQEESRRISGRVTWGQTRQMERGVVFGRSLLGYEVRNGKLFVEETGAKTVRLIFQKYALEQMGTAELARYLTDHGYETMSGRTNWTPSGIIKLLHNEKYVGDLVQQKTYTPDYLTHQKKTNRGERPLQILTDHHAPIISRELWELAQDRLQRNSRHRAGERGCGTRHLLSGMIYCGNCGRVFRSRMKRSGQNMVRYWCCPSSPACGVKRLLRDDEAMWMLQTAMSEMELDWNTLFEETAKLVVSTLLKKETQTQVNRNRLSAKKQAVLDAYFSGHITLEEMEYMKRQYDETEKKYRRTEEMLLLERKKTPDQQKILSELIKIRDENRCLEGLYRCILGKMTIENNGETEVFFKDLSIRYRYKSKHCTNHPS